MRVLIVSNFYPPNVVGGAELVASDLAKWLAQSGQEVTVVSTCAMSQRATDSIDDGIRVVRYFPLNLWWNFDRFRPGDRRSAFSRLVWNLRDGWNRHSGKRFDAILAAVQPDIVHTHNIKGMSPIIWAATRRRSIPIVHTAHDYHLVCQGGTMTRRSVDCAKRCFGCAMHGRWYAARSKDIDLLCSPSRLLLERHNAFGIAANRSVVVPNGRPGVPRLRHPQSADRPMSLLFLGRLQREKGAHLLPSIITSLPATARLHIAGTGSMASDLASAATDDPRIVLHGFVGASIRENLLDSADALLLPSLWTENAPLVLIEAFLAGLPVIASRIGAIPEFVQDGVNGLLVEPGNPDAFAKAARRMHQEPELHAKLSLGATKAAARYTVIAMGERYLALYADQVADARRGRA